MKRFMTTLAMLLLTAMPTMAEHVTPETARKVATTFLTNNGAKAAQLTDLSKAAGFANLYIFTANPGFVVMAADDCVQPILGYSLDGFILDEDMPDNVRGWLQGYNDEIQFAIDNRMRASSETAKLWKELMEGNTKAGRATTVVAPLIQTQWNQNGGYYGSTYVTLFNNLCPPQPNNPSRNCVTGCVATAMAQIMKFHNYPAHGIGSHSYTWNNQTLSADFANTNYDWTNMTNTYGKNSTETAKLAVATLMYHCGVSVNMSYGSSSSASTADVAEALKTYFNYSPDIEYRSKNSFTDEVWTNMVKAELVAGRPLQYRGSTGSGGGHSFVCDGYDSNDKFHFNWGWAGSYDGYFSLDNLDTGANTQTGAGNGDYTDNQGAIFGIRPVQCDASEPTNLTYTLNGLQNVTLSWTAASGAASYNIYCNNNYIGNFNTTSYTENAPFGNNEYYVRSVDANGELSLPTNTVSIYIGYQQPVVDNLEATLSGNYAVLNWAAPEWCFPETPSATLSYGEDDLYYSWTSVYYGHRYLASDLSTYAGKKVYQVETYIKYPGRYSIYVFNKTKSDQPDPDYLAYSKEGISISYANANKWNRFDLETPVTISGSDDLWVVFKQEGTGQTYPTPSFDLASHNINAFYAGNSPTNLYDANSSYNCAWFIRAHLTDGTYTYNLYQDGTKIAEYLNETTYSGAILNDNGPNLFSVKTNYYGGESATSNKIGFAKGTASVASLEQGDKMTVTKNSQLTVTGTLSNDNAANLVIENGAQLIHNSNDVKATVNKTIAPYSTVEDGWNFIASPVIEDFTPSADNGLLSSTYDLYYYDEPTHYWMNHKPGNTNSGFNLTHKHGYLYANSAETTLQFAGTLAPSDADVSVTGLSHSATTLNGFNLIGNPFACNATVNQDCYVIDGNQVKLATTNPVLAPCEGVMVKADSDAYTVTFTKQTSAKANANSKSLDLVVTQGKSTLDRARVRFGDGTNLEKFSLEGNESTQLAFWQEGQDYAVAYANGQNELPLNFKVAENDTYTIAIESNSLGVDYLHLIDNMTGADIDLLTTPSYTFDAKTTDYTSRFRLIFSVEDGPSTGSGTFAFIGNGEIRLVQTCHGATLQLVDLTGRVILCTDAASQVSTAGIPSGVYVLRLINGENTMTQKIVIE